MINFISLLLAAAAVQVLGGILTWFFVKKFCSNFKKLILAEMLLMATVSLLLIEEGLKITPFAAASLLAGIITFGLLNKTIPHKHETEAERVSFLVFIAMCLHEFPEGIAFGASYIINPYLGLTTAALIALHNLPEGSIVSIPFFMKKNFAMGLKAVLITQLLYVIGGLTSYYLLKNISPQLQAMGMTFAAGAMLYIIAEELLLSKKSKC